VLEHPDLLTALEWRISEIRLRRDDCAQLRARVEARELEEALEALDLSIERLCALRRRVTPG
jgi:hypothetical protein